MQKYINGATLKAMFIGASKVLNNNRARIDSLNVFPVPDGDTGTNMSYTMKSAIKELEECESTAIADYAGAVAHGALRGARGNSGVILSQILRGFCNYVSEHNEIDTKTFARGLDAGAKVAYSAVSKPKEGTILTVARMTAECALSCCSKNKDFEAFFSEILKKCNEALELTPELLPVLKKAGVVDSGGAGLQCIFTGMYKALIGEEIEEAPVAEEEKEETPAFSGDNADIIALGNIQFAYCTEFFVINLKKKTTIADIDKLREKLLTIGDCVIVIGDLEFVKVHVHTNTPNVALAEALKLGELDRIKIENMLEENRALQKKLEEERKPMGMLAVSAGEGLTTIFKELGVDGVISGGQSMNPSASDIADAVQKINASNVFVFPNNKNIILAAEQAKSLVKNKQIHVIPTKSIPQGFSSAMSFNPEATLEENKANMIHSLDNVKSGQVTYAVRNTSVDGFDLKEGDVIGLDSKNILTKGDDIDKVVIDLISAMISANDSMITLYYGENKTAEEAEALKEKVSNAYPDCDVEAYEGGQPIYYYLVAIE